VTVESSKHGRERGIATKQRISNFRHLFNNRKTRATTSEPLPRIKKARNATQPAPGIGDGRHCRTVGRQARTGLSVGRPVARKLDCCGLWGILAQRTSGYQAGILCEEDPSWVVFV